MVVFSILSYDILGRVTQKKVKEYNGAELYTENYTYLNLSTGTTITTTTTASDTTTAVLKEYYDQYGRHTKSESIADGITLTTLYENDCFGNITKETDPKGNATAYEYNYAGQVTKATNAQGNSVSTAYDLAGRAVSVTDAKGNTINTTYDKLGRVVKTLEPLDYAKNKETHTYYDKNSNTVKTLIKNGTSDLRVNEFKYDNMGNVTANILKNGASDIVTQYEYDIANRVTKMITGLSAYSETPTGGNVTSYTYDNLGNVSKITDPMGGKTTYALYDTAGNPEWKIDKNGETTVYEYGSYGVLNEEFFAGDEKKAYTYDKLGRMTASSSVNANGNEVTESYAYDGFGNITKATNAKGKY